MIRKLLFLLILTIISTIGRSYATTWDEPWDDQVIKDASSFVLAKVVACDPEKGISIQIIKTIGGNKLLSSLIISDFYLLTLCSGSGGGGEFHTSIVDSCYFFITRNNEGKYCIATPTTGFDYVTEGQVTATFRHSYHQALVPVSIYEKTMTAVFNNYHNLPYDKDYISSFVTKYLTKTPAGFEENEINIFFLQHVALECVHHLRLKINENLIIPFLTDKRNFHSQVSAARAMVAFNTNTSKQELLKIISDTAQRHFVQVMCIWTLADFNPTDLKSKLEELAIDASDEHDGFGGNIMDPRICTSIPTVKKALKNLIGKL
jgi:hypothetical protein